ncbi:MAG: biopolymer transporter ExbD [Candidatus Manganitrophaceae bacterium]
MRRFSKSSHGAVSELNITPLLDLAWVLLVVFILTATAAVQGIEVQLPKSTPSETNVESTVRAITVRRTGEVYLDEQKVELVELEGLLRGLKEAKGGSLPVVLRGDEGVEYRFVVAVLDVMQRVPIEQVGLATKPSR